MVCQVGSRGQRWMSDNCHVRCWRGMVVWGRMRGNRDMMESPDDCLLYFLFGAMLLKIFLKNPICLLEGWLGPRPKWPNRGSLSFGHPLFAWDLQYRSLSKVDTREHRSFVHLVGHGSTAYSAFTGKKPTRELPGFSKRTRQWDMNLMLHQDSQCWATFMAAEMGIYQIAFPGKQSTKRINQTHHHQDMYSCLLICFSVRTKSKQKNEHCSFNCKTSSSADYLVTGNCKFLGYNSHWTKRYILSVVRFFAQKTSDGSFSFKLYLTKKDFTFYCFGFARANSVFVTSRFVKKKSLEAVLAACDQRSNVWISHSTGCWSQSLLSPLSLIFFLNFPCSC